MTNEELVEWLREESKFWHDQANANASFKDIYRVYTERSKNLEIAAHRISLLSSVLKV